MNNSISFNCWKCGVRLEEVPMPLSRAEMCSGCRADLHVCRQCDFYDTSKAQACREPIADNVSDKTGANFCGYLMVKTDLSQDMRPGGDDLQALGELFGVNALDAVTPSTNEQAQSALDDLFGVDPEKNKTK